MSIRSRLVSAVAAVALAAGSLTVVADTAQAGPLSPASSVLAVSMLPPSAVVAPEPTRSEQE